MDQTIPVEKVNFDMYIYMINWFLIDNSLILCHFRMSVDTDFDYFSCYLDLLGYQKNEITDSISQMLDIRAPILEEGLLLCTFKLPTNNYDFKMCLRKFCHYPLLLEKFSIEMLNNLLCRIRFCSPWKWEDINIS